MSDNGRGSKTNARLQAVKGHLQLRPPLTGSAWESKLTIIRDLQKQNRTPKINDRGYQLQKSRGKLWVWERIDSLFDENTFFEIGSLVGTVKKAGRNSSEDQTTIITPSNQVTGLGLIAERKVGCAADDFSIRGGHADGASWERSVGH